MRRALLLVPALIALLLASQPASAAFVTGCCACLADHTAQTSQLPPSEQAIFCGRVTGTGFPEFVQQCDAAGGGSAPCYKEHDGLSCNAVLAEEGIACPASPGVPAATSWGLAALALALTTLGITAMRRRAR